MPNTLKAWVIEAPKLSPFTIAYNFGGENTSVKSSTAGRRPMMNSCSIFYVCK